MGDCVRLLDQTLLPTKEEYLDIKTVDAMWEAIKELKVRGAPAIGVAAGYGLCIGVQKFQNLSLSEFRQNTLQVADYLSTSRPTAVNLFWALDRMRNLANSWSASNSPQEAYQLLVAEAQQIEREDIETCNAIGEHGASLLDGLRGVITHCNTGALATAGIGTAFGVIKKAADRNPALQVYADETRPLLQGARLTMWELKKAGIKAKLMTDGMGAMAMKNGLAQAVIVGADRIAANGDSANKIGTFMLAIAAKHFLIPFYIAAPLSTVDLTLESGEGIPIEMRGAEEVTKFGGIATAPEGSEAFSPAFDVTPHDLIAGIVTEAGVLRPPYEESLQNAFQQRSHLSSK